MMFFVELKTTQKMVCHDENRKEFKFGSAYIKKEVTKNRQRLIWLFVKWFFKNFGAFVCAMCVCVCF